MAHAPCAEKCGATARCQAHYEQIWKERKRRTKKTQERGRRFKKPSDGNRQRKSTKKNQHFQTAKFRRLSERRWQGVNGGDSDTGSTERKNCYPSAPIPILG
jgi:hypothetical protein